MSLKDYIATHDNMFLSGLKFFLYKLKNKYYHVNEIIQESAVQSDGLLKVVLKDGLVLYSKPSASKAEIQYSDRIKFGDKSKLSKVIDVDKFYFMYEVLSELFVENVHFQYFKPQPNEVIIDCGANIGGFTIQAARLVGSGGKVIAIEPDEDNYNLLLKNIHANNFTNVIAVKKGAWSEKDVLTFHVGLRPGEHSFVLHDDIANQSQLKEVRIEVDTIDSMLKEQGITKVNFIKMDIEGAELEAIKGLNSVFAQSGTNWVVEAGHLINGSMTFDKIEKYMKEQGCNILSTQEAFRGTIYATK